MEQTLWDSPWSLIGFVSDCDSETYYTAEYLDFYLTLGPNPNPLP